MGRAMMKLIVGRWHGTVLAKLALVPQNTMNSYHEKESSMATDSGLYKDGDFILNFGDCTTADRKCETEMKPYVGRSLQQQHQQ
jgi:mannan polymerase II complex MNN11 subunit